MPTPSMDITARGPVVSTIGLHVRRQVVRQTVRRGSFNSPTPSLFLDHTTQSTNHCFPP